jgi:hypothetical protein
MADRVRLRVWCEDHEHESFVRQLFVNLGLERRNINFTLPPGKGKGSASAWVMAQYAEVRTEARGTRNQANLGFLVVVDGDSSGVQARMKTLHPTAQDNRESSDRIAIFIPTWEIENWVLWLSGTYVAESKSYKSDVDRDKFADLLKLAIPAWSSPRPNEENLVPSLSSARTEMRRLPLPSAPSDA